MPPGCTSRFGATPDAVAHPASKPRAVGRAHQHDRVLAGVKARRFAPPPLRGADGLDAGCAHGPGEPARQPGNAQTGRAQNLMC